MRILSRWCDLLAPVILLIALGGVYWFDSLFAPQPGTRREKPQQVADARVPTLLAPTISPTAPTSDTNAVVSELPPASDGSSDNEPGQASPGKPASDGDADVREQPLASVGSSTDEPEHSLKVEPPPEMDEDVPYTQYKGHSLIAHASKDKFGNPEGSKYDLARDGAFKGLQIAVIHMYTGEGFDFRDPAAALEEKGFAIHRWITRPPPAKELREVLKESCQLWVISDRSQKLGNDHLTAIRSFFDSGRGVYIWGDNEPFYADANYVAQELLGASLSGNLIGDQTVRVKVDGSVSGMVPNHAICTGIENLYEGITIATVQDSPNLQPIVFGSAGNLVVAAYDRDGKRALLDGGYTRLCHKWDTAGTGRYVKNAAAWLVNYERFGRTVFRRAELEEFLVRLRDGDQGQIVQACRSADELERWAAILVARERKLPLHEEFISLLRDVDRDVRKEARDALVELAEGPDFGPSGKADAAEVEKSVTQWSRWFTSREYLARYSSLPENELVTLFEDADPLKRWAAVIAARERRLAVHERLIERLGDEDPDVRREARLAIAALAGDEYDYGPDPDDVLAAREEAITRWSKWWQREQLLPRFDGLSPDELVAQFDAPASLERWSAVTVARRRGAGFPEPLVRMLRDPDKDVRQEARRALVTSTDGKDFGPPDNGTPEEVAKAAAAWDSWWAAEKKRLETLADNRLKIAKMILRGNEAKGRKHLQTVIDQYGWTQAAAEAGRILSGPPASRGSSAPVDKPTAATRQAEREKEAADQLEQAKSSLADSPTLRRIALTGIVRDYPGTKAAKEAQRLLKRE